MNGFESYPEIKVIICHRHSFQWHIPQHSRLEEIPQLTFPNTLTFLYKGECVLV